MWNKLKDSFLLWIVVSLALWPEIMVVLLAAACAILYAEMN